MILVKAESCHGQLTQQVISIVACRSYACPRNACIEERKRDNYMFVER